MDELVARDGVDGFIVDLADIHIPAVVDGPAVLFEVQAVDGARVGQLVRTGVSLNELSAWPAIPPHWVHFPIDVRIEPTNVDMTDVAPGYQRHSRQIEAWNTNDHPGSAWAAHVRSLLSGAVA